MEGLPRANFISSVVLFALLFSTTNASSIDFIKSSCKATRYRTLCVKSLSIYASAIQESPKQLARIALDVSLTRMRLALKFVSKLSRAKGLKARQRAAVMDCLDNVGDSVYQLVESAWLLSRMGGRGSSKFLWQMMNVQSRVSAAMTDDYTCLDGLAARAGNWKLKAALRRRVVHVERVTSNALCLVILYARKA